MEICDKSKRILYLVGGLTVPRAKCMAFHHTQPHAQPQVVYMADMPMALHTGQPLPVLRSAYMTHGVYAVHLLQFHDTYEMDAYFHDIVLHLYALECMTKARWPGLDIRLPWHFAILACA